MTPSVKHPGASSGRAPSVGPTVVLPPAVRVGPLSAVWRPRQVAVLLATTLAALVVATVAVGTGEFFLGPGRVLEVLGGAGTRREDVVVWQVRLPRVLLGLVAGVALGLSGAVVQTVARNPLASPDLLGVTAGASVGAVAVITLGGDDPVGGVLRGLGVPLASCVGGLLASLLVFWIARRAGAASGLGPVLVGIGVSALLGSLVSWLMISASIDTAVRANVWLTGTLNGRSWHELWVVVAVVSVCLPVLAVAQARLAPLALGVDVARGLGVRVSAAVGVLLVVAVALASVTTAMLGPIAFVALVCPHLARLACGGSRAPLAVSGILGALLLTASDLAARVLVPTVQVPVGAVTALVGAPFLLWLLVRTRKEPSR